MCGAPIWPRSSPLRPSCDGRVRDGVTAVMGPAGIRETRSRLTRLMLTMSVRTPAPAATSVDVAVLRSKAADLRCSADRFDGPLAAAYRRRAAELELEAAALAARLGLVEDSPLAA